MVKLNYSVKAGLLTFPNGKSIEVGLSQWWDWLESSEVKSFRFECDHGVKNFTARKERVKDLEVWYAYKSLEGKLRKRYIGKSEQLTQERLEIVAYGLEKEPQSRQKKESLHSELGNDVGEYRELLNQSRRTAAQRESDFERLLAQKIQLQDELKQLKDVLAGRDRLFQETAREAADQIASLKQQLKEATSLLPSQLCNSEMEGLKAELERLAQERDKLEAQLSSTQKRLEKEAADAQKYYPGWRKLPGLESELRFNRAKREELTQRISELEAENQALKNQAIAQPLHSEVGNNSIDAAELLNQLKPLLGKGSKLTLTKLEAIIDGLVSESEPKPPVPNKRSWEERVDAVMAQL